MNLNTNFKKRVCLGFCVLSKKTGLQTFTIFLLLGENFSKNSMYNHVDFVMFERENSVKRYIYVFRNSLCTLKAQKAQAKQN